MLFDFICLKWMLKPHNTYIPKWRFFYLLNCFSIFTKVNNTLHKILYLSIVKYFFNHVSPYFGLHAISVWTRISIDSTLISISKTSAFLSVLFYLPLSFSLSVKFSEIEWEKIYQDLFTTSRPVISPLYPVVWFPLAEMVSIYWDIAILQLYI